MLNHLTTYWYLWLALAVMIILAFFVWGKAMAASRRHRERVEKEIAAIEKEKRLREKYKNLTVDLIKNAPDEELLEGISTFVQIKVEKSANINDEFSKLPDILKEMYALNFFCEDAENTLSSFFRNNGEPLLSLAVPALKRIGAAKDAHIVNQMYSMFDESNESVSYDTERIANLNDSFKELNEATELRLSAAAYIKQNSEEICKSGKDI